MPKIVDHEQRRREIAQAAVRVVERKGLERATVREIAQEAGYSTGVLAHYFADKRQIMVQAHLTAFAAARARIEAWAEHVDDPVRLLRVALEEAFPLDATRLTEAQVDVTFWATARQDPALLEVRTASHAEAVRFWTGLVQAIADAGLARPGLDVARTGVLTQVVIDGVSAQATLFPGHMTPEAQRRIIDDHLRAVLRDDDTPTGG